MNQRMAVRVVYAAMVVIGAIYVLANPVYFWDIVGYTGVAASYSQSAEAAQRTTFEQLRQQIPAEEYAELTDGAADYNPEVNRYRHLVSTDPVAFAQQLPFYRFRFIYTGLLYVLHKLGLPIVLAARLIGAAAFCLYGAVVYLWISRHFTGAKLILWAGVALMASWSMITARLLTPDMMAGAVVMAGYYLLLERRAIVAGVVVLVLAVMTRTDYLVYALMLLPLMIWLETEPTSRVLCAAGLVGAVATSVSINAIFRHYGWSIMIQHTFFAPLPRPAESHPIISFSRYLHLLRREMGGGIWIKLVMLVAFTLATLLPSRQPAATANRWRGAAIVMLLGIMLHYLLFPGYWERFFVANLTVTAICVAVVHAAPTHRDEDRATLQSA